MFLCDPMSNIFTLSTEREITIPSERENLQCISLFIQLREKERDIISRTSLYS